jgi:NAD(P)-dependent dehydrogenase (short-subunit alcohol dehydrogenase family)
MRITTSQVNKDRNSVTVLGARRGSGNIGEAIVSRMNQAGWNVYASDCREDEGFEDYGVPDLVATEGLVVTLGKTMIRPFWDLDVTTDAVEEMIRANLTLPLQCVARYVEVCEWMSDLKYPKRIVLIGSYAHRHPFTNGTLYCAAKAGIEMAAKTLAWELTPLGYTINAVHPYHVEGTPMWEEVQAGVETTKEMTREEADNYARKDLRLERLCRADDVAEAVEVILEGSMTDYFSGSSVELYGGVR